MADIIEIKTINAELRVGSRVFKIHDPAYLSKVKLRKEIDKFQADIGSMTSHDRAEKFFEIQCKNLKLYMPELEDSFLNEIGEHAFTALIEGLNEAIATNFGVKAITEKKT